MYEFIKTETGWRVFWGIDPCPANTRDAHHDDNDASSANRPRRTQGRATSDAHHDDNDASTECCLLPFPQTEHSSSFCPVA